MVNIDEIFTEQTINTDCYDKVFCILYIYYLQMIYKCQIDVMQNHNKTKNKMTCKY